MFGHVRSLAGQDAVCIPIVQRHTDHTDHTDRTPILITRVAHKLKILCAL